MKTKLAGEPILIFDIESKTIDARPNPKKDILRVFGAYSYLTDKYYVLTDIDDVKKLVNNHKYFVGWNTLGYDNPILERCGLKEYIITNKYGDARFKKKYDIDMYQIFKHRAGTMKIKEGMLGDLLMSYSLDFVSQMIGVVKEDDGKIKDFDYDLLKKDVWTPAEAKLIKDYTVRDLEVTRKVYEWLEEYFVGFKDFLHERDVYGKKYLTDSMAVYTYKVICKELGLEVEFQNGVDAESFGGGYVAFPSGEEFAGNILLFDFASLYPNIFIQANLFGNHCSCCEPHEKWTGDSFFKVRGAYCTKELTPFSKLLKKFYLMRKEMKKNKDPREYSIKLVINTSYGICANPAFKHVFNMDAAADCTGLGRQFIMYVRKRFRDAGYENLLTDTDSTAILIPDGKTKEDAVKLANEITEEICSHLPFAW